FCYLTLDPNTTHRTLILSEKNRVVRDSGREQEYSDHPERFDSLWQVLCKESVCGRCYWEVEWSGVGVVFISMSYKDISRKGRGDECGFGLNNQSWSLWCSSSSLSFYHNNIKTDLRVPSPSRIGVYVDHSAGTLSFYSVSDTMKLLHRVHTTFTQPLYAGFWVCLRSYCMDTVDSRVHAYDRQSLIQYRYHAITNLHDDVLEKLRDLGLLRRPGLQSSASPDAGGRERGCRKQCSRKRKRGKRAGVRARLKTNPSRLALPSIILSNVCSLNNKLDYIGYSDHISVMLIPAYRPLVRRSKAVLKQVKTWPAGAISALQDCFECNDWNMFREAATNGDYQLGGVHHISDQLHRQVHR
ncbi:hypothetical protein QTP70_001256, partial [Hemibagrus guttatus]